MKINREKILEQIKHETKSVMSMLYNQIITYNIADSKINKIFAKTDLLTFEYPITVSTTPKFDISKVSEMILSNENKNIVLRDILFLKNEITA